MPNISASYRNVCGTSEGEVFVFNWDCFFRFNGAEWSMLNEDWGSSGVADLVKTSMGHLVGISFDGDVRIYQGAGWESGLDLETTELQAIWGFSDQDIFAVGRENGVYRFDGNSWIPQDVDSGPNLESVWGSSPNDVFVGGWDGEILHFDGQSWTELDTGFDAEIRDIWGVSGTDVFASTRYGGIYHFDGSTWTLAANTDSYDLWSLWGFSADWNSPGFIDT